MLEGGDCVNTDDSSGYDFDQKLKLMENYPMQPLIAGLERMIPSAGVR
jgi:hypothetical protein